MKLHACMGSFSHIRSNQKLPCTFELDVPGLGILEGNAGENVCFLSMRLSFCERSVLLNMCCVFYLDQSRNAYWFAIMAGWDAFYRVSSILHYQCLGERVSSNYRSARLGTSRLVTLDLPSALSERVMNALKADPRTVDLRSLAPHFYSLSERILELFEEEELVEVLSNVWCCCNPG